MVLLIIIGGFVILAILAAVVATKTDWGRTQPRTEKKDEPSEPRA